MKRRLNADETPAELLNNTVRADWRACRERKVAPLQYSSQFPGGISGANRGGM